MIIAPSLLAANFAKLGHEVKRVAHAKADWLHLDIMDGHFVPNISFGPGVVKTLRPLSPLFFDMHLMCTKPEILLDAFVAAGADRLTVHIELGPEAVTSLLWKIKSLGKKVGLAINPGTPMAVLEPFLHQVDLILVMTVNPGFGGQPFIRECLPKIQQAYEWRRDKKLSYHIEVDGGINFDTATQCAGVGADAFVAGTGIFGEKSLRGAVKKMRSLVESHSRAHHLIYA